MATERGVGTDPRLEASGWVRRHLADPARAREAEETYVAAGFEVLLQALTPADFGSRCQECAQSACSAYVVIYTRKALKEAP